jgi:hypothetical protein
MTVRGISVVTFLLGACAAACGQGPAGTLPPARLAPVPGPVLGGDPAAPLGAPLLPVPPPQDAPRKPCLPCQTDYQPNHVYLPDANPDCGAGGCDGECRPCRRYWASLAFLVGGTEKLGEIHQDLAYGLAGGAGYWFDDTKTFGLEVNGLSIHTPHHEIFFDTYVNAPLTVWTSDANARMELLAQDRFRLDALIGYRYVDLHEKIFANSASGLAAEDRRQNNINVGQVGIVGNYKFGGYFCELLAKVGIGRNSEAATLNGVRLSDSDMIMVPEFGARVGYQLGEGVYGTLGYTFLYLSNVTRPGHTDSTDFYLHGFTIGMECRF